MLPLCLVPLLLLGSCKAASIPTGLLMKVQSNTLGELTAESSNFIHAALPQSKYLVYNVLQLDHQKPVSFAAYPYGKPGSSYVTSSFNYYGTPLYNYEIELRPIYPNINVQSFVPNYIPQQPQQPITTTTERPLPFDEDKIEKLDEKLDPSLEMNLKHDESRDDEDDTVVVEAI